MTLLEGGPGQYWTSVMLKGADEPTVNVVAPSGAFTGSWICNDVPPEALNTYASFAPTVTLAEALPKFVPLTKGTPPGHKEFESDSF